MHNTERRPFKSSDTNKSKKDHESHLFNEIHRYVFLNWGMPRDTWILPAVFCINHYIQLQCIRLVANFSDVLWKGYLNQYLKEAGI